MQSDEHTITITGGSLCHKGQLLKNSFLQFSASRGTILCSTADQTTPQEDSVSRNAKPGRLVNLGQNDIVAPGILELQTNGLCGVHFTTLTQGTHEAALGLVAQEMAKNGVTGWYATIPTVPEERWREIIPLLKPRSFVEINGSPLLGVHVEGPYLHPSKKGAHNDSFFRTPALHNYHELYGRDNLRDAIRYLTIAPELEGAIDMIQDIKKSYPHIVISIGHSTATYEQGIEAIKAGATSITHVFNAMNPLHHREPGLAGLVGFHARQLDGIDGSDVANQNEQSLDAANAPYITMITDNIHLHPAILRLCYYANPARCILITDSIELAGLPDGIYPPNGQITYPQRKVGNRATNVADQSKGEKETLVGSCVTLLEGIRIMAQTTGVTLGESVNCASTNVANLMRDRTRGQLTAGRRADLVVLDSAGQVKQTWIGGNLVWRVKAPGK